MSDKLGMVNYGETDEPTFLGRDMGRSRDYSEATAQEIDKEVKQFCDTAYEKAREILTARRAQLDAIAKALLEYETLNGEQVKDLIELGRMRNPPKPGLSAPTPPTAAAEKRRSRSRRVASSSRQTIPPD